MERKGIVGFKENRETKDRNDSCGSLEEMWKRKRKEQGKVERREEEIFRGSKKTVMSPDMEKEKEKWVEEMMRRLKRKKVRGDEEGT